jgi:hypothetical protein
VQAILKQIKADSDGKTNPEMTEWKETLRNFQKIVGKIELLFGYLVTLLKQMEMHKSLNCCVLKASLCKRIFKH